MLTFFNLQNDNKLIKESAKITLDSIRVNTKIYVPMLAPRFTLSESNSYDSLTDSRFEAISATARETLVT